MPAKDGVTILERGSVKKKSQDSQEKQLLLTKMQQVSL